MAKIKPCPGCGKAKVNFLYGCNSSKWGAAFCAYCGWQAPEVRTGYDEREDAPWHKMALNEWNDRFKERE